MAVDPYQITKARKALGDATRQLIEARGHVIGTTIQEGGGWAAQCSTCQHWASFAVFKGEDPITGYLARLDCPGDPVPA